MYVNLESALKADGREVCVFDRLFVVGTFLIVYASCARGGCVLRRTQLIFCWLWSIGRADTFVWKSKTIAHMNKLSLLTALGAVAFSPIVVNAQNDSAVGLRYVPTHKGALMLGADIMSAQLGFGDGAGAFYHVAAAPKAGYFISDKLAVGASINTVFQGARNYNSQSYGIGAFGRYYFGKATNSKGELNRFRFFVEGGLGYSRGTAALTEGNVTTRGNFTTANAYVMPGFSCFLTKNVALDGGLHYMRTWHSNNLVGQPANIGLNIGLRFFFGGKK